jgi:hypothetical protein
LRAEGEIDARHAGRVECLERAGMDARSEIKAREFHRNRNDDPAVLSERREGRSERRSRNEETKVNERRLPGTEGKGELRTGRWW